MTLHHGDALAILPTLGDASVDAVVTDPPYELGFMGKAWDATGIAYNVDLWREVARVLKPGAHLLAFGGTRTYHRLAVAIEDAGFEIRDSLHWLYGSGFPKGKNYDGGIGTTLKPAHEPIVLARKPPDGTIANTIERYGTGGINIDAARIPYADADDLATTTAKNPGRDDLVTSDVYAGDRPQQSVTAAGRWPPNVAFTHDIACTADDCIPSCPVADLDLQSGVSTSGVVAGVGAFNPAKATGIYGVADTYPDSGDDVGYGDTGGASRYFPVFRYEAKASTAERNAGLRELPTAFAPTMNPGIGAREHHPDEPAAHRHNHHPTVKPLGLMRWLIRLVTPVDGIVLDPFLGSGTTAAAAILEGRDWLGIERDADYLDIIKARVAWAEAQGVQLDLFG